MRNSDAQKLLNMFIVDLYSPSGKVKKKTAVEAMRYVSQHSELQTAVNNGDNKKIIDFSEGLSK